MTTILFIILGILLIICSIQMIMIRSKNEMIDYYSEKTSPKVLVGIEHYINRETQFNAKIKKKNNDVTFWQGKFHAIRHENNKLRNKLRRHENRTESNLRESVSAEV